MASSSTLYDMEGTFGIKFGEPKYMETCILMVFTFYFSSLILACSSGASCMVNVHFLDILDVRVFTSFMSNVDYLSIVYVIDTLPGSNLCN